MRKFCQRCGDTKNLTKHHAKKGIQTLCRDCHDRVHNIISIPKNKRWSNEEIEKLMILYKKGKSYEKISKELGRTRSSCYTMVHNVKMFVDTCSSKIRGLVMEK